MEEQFKNKTKCSKKEYNMFIKAHEKEYGFREDLYTIIYLIFFICIIVYAVIKTVYYLGVLIIIVLAIFIFYRVIRPSKVIQKELNSKKVKDEYVNTYSFYKLFFTILNKEGKAKIFYWKIYRVLENKTHFYIYITNKKAYVISKQGFIKGTSKEFGKFLKKRTFFKYKKNID